MFKKFIITILLLLPFLLIFIGYPLEKNNISNMNQLQISRRCFIAGDVKQYALCLKNKKLQGINVLITIISDINNELSFYGYVFILFIISQLSLVYFIVNDLEKKD